MTNPTSTYYADTDTLHITLCDTPSAFSSVYEDGRIVIHYNEADKPVAVTVERPTSPN